MVSFVKKGKTKTYRAHGISIRQRNFESSNEILFSKEDLRQSVKENMRHEKAYNEIARDLNVMCFYLNRDVEKTRDWVWLALDCCNT